jgi:hypothetical protein
MTTTDQNTKKLSWKTSVAGVLGILGGLTLLAQMVQAGKIDPAQITAGITAITAGVGLIFARDNNVNSEQVGVAPAQIAMTDAISAQAHAAPTTSTNPVTGAVTLTPAAPVAPVPLQPTVIIPPHAL